MKNLVLSLVISLLLTLFLETGFALVFKKRKRDLLLTVLVNIVTNPPVVLFSWLAGVYMAKYVVFIKIVLEILAILIEAFYYKKYGDEFHRPFLFSLGANSFSFGTGFILNRILL